MARYGYMLLDPEEQDVSRQAVQLDGIGGFDRVFVDRVSSMQGRQLQRPQRERLLSLLQPEDVVYAAAIDRLADQLKDFLVVCDQLEERGAHLMVLEEGLDTRSPAGRQCLKILESCQQLDFRYQSLRKKAGIKEAKAKGRRIGRPPVAIPPDFRGICLAWSRGEMSGKQAAERSGLKPTSFYKKAAELGFKPHPEHRKRKG